VEEALPPQELKIFDSSKKITTLYDLVQSLKKFDGFSQKRILLIDDEEFCLSSMRAILFNLGIDIENNVDICMNGKEAVDLVEHAQTLGIKYKLIFTDFNMPIMNGIEATAEMRLIFKEQPIIVGITGYASSKYHQIGLEAGMDAVIAKPLYV
jgi:CheY-like chemotaxis protein